MVIRVTVACQNETCKKSFQVELNDDEIEPHECPECQNNSPAPQETVATTDPWDFLVRSESNRNSVN